MLNAKGQVQDTLRVRQAACNTERYLQDEWGEGRALEKGPAGREKMASQGSKPIQGLEWGGDVN